MQVCAVSEITYTILFLKRRERLRRSATRAHSFERVLLRTTAGGGHNTYEMNSGRQQIIFFRKVRLMACFTITVLDNRFCLILLFLKSIPFRSSLGPNYLAFVVQPQIVVYMTLDSGDVPTFPRLYLNENISYHFRLRKRRIWMREPNRYCLGMAANASRSTFLVNSWLM